MANCLNYDFNMIVMNTDNCLNHASHDLRISRMFMSNHVNQANQENHSSDKSRKSQPFKSLNF